MSITLDHFHHTAEIQVRWSDMDALGHVNNATYLTYLEQARIQYFNHVRQSWGSKPDEVGLIMARVEIDYKTPLFADRPAQVHTRVVRLGNKSFTTEQWITRTNATAEIELVAQAMVTIVVFDYSTQRSTPIPQAWRDAIRQLDPEVQEG